MSYPQLDLNILKSITSNRKRALEFAAQLDEKVFDQTVWMFSKHIVGYIKNYKEVPTLRGVIEKLKSDKNDLVINKIKEVWELLEKTEYDDREFPIDLESIKNRYLEKKIVEYKNHLNEVEVINPATQLIKLRKLFTDIKSTEEEKTFEKRTLKQNLPLFAELYNAKKNKDGSLKGLKTGFAAFDRYTGGLEGSDFVLIIGESNAGKSLLLNSMGMDTWLQGNTIDNLDDSKGANVLLFSLEMPYANCFDRLLARLSGVAFSKIKNAQLNKEEFKKVRLATDFIKSSKYEFEIVDMPDASSNDVKRVLDETLDNYQPHLIVVDYLGIMRTNDDVDEADWMKQQMAAYELRTGISRKYNIPILTAAQATIKSAKEGQEVGMSRISRSRNIMSHATTALQIEMRDKEALDPMMYPDSFISIIKNRNGAKGRYRIMKDFANSSFFDAEENKEDGQVSDSFTEYNPEDLSERLMDLDV